MTLVIFPGKIQEHAIAVHLFQVLFVKQQNHHHQKPTNYPSQQNPLNSCLKLDSEQLNKNIVYILLAIDCRRKL